MRPSAFSSSAREEGREHVLNGNGFDLVDDGHLHAPARSARGAKRAATVLLETDSQQKDQISDLLEIACSASSESNTGSERLTERFEKRTKNSSQISFL